MGVSVRPIRYSDILLAPNVEDLLDAYADECSVPLIGKPSPQPEMYDAMERAGALICFGAYVDDDLVGFSAVVMYLNPHYGRKLAVVESIFVAKGYRSMGLGKMLLSAIESCSGAAECPAVLYSAPVGTRFHQFLALNPEYVHTNCIFARSLA
jgi:GNAT superfamily N-acetyltransferase